MARLLLILGIFFLVWMAYRYLKGSWSTRVKEVQNKEQQQSSIQTMRACAYCKTHIPENDGLEEDGRFFCSYQHLDHYREHHDK